MSVKTLHDLPNELYFCTFTCTNWLPLFEDTKTYDQVYEWFTIANDKNFRTCAFVIMPNHLHFIMATPYKNAKLNTLVSNGKRFLAYDIVNRLKNSGNDYLLKQLANEVTPSDSKRGKLHQVFKSSFDGRRIIDEKMLFQKIEYIHHNPVRGKWRLVSDFVLYEHSSAAFYELGKPCQFPITHYAEILHGR
ncbi:MAG: transposase [Chitinophagaceae bacterium]|nr:transposase [Chitinophagaceae bacterium]